MNRKLSRRSRNLIITGAGIFLVMAAVSFWMWLQFKPEKPYRPGEKIEGLTAGLSRSLPSDYPRLQFVDAAKAAGIDFQHFSGKRSSQLPEDMGSGAAWGDYDNDGWLDLFVANIAGPLTMSEEEIKNSPAHCALYHNNGNGTFTEVSKQAGVDYHGWAMAAAWSDYNNDGWLDLFISTYGENVFYHNNGDGTFADRTRQSGLGGRKGFWTGASWADFNRDGFLDLYVCGYVQYTFIDPKQVSTQYEAEVPASINPSSFEPAGNLLYRNNRNGTFTELSAKAKVENAQGRSLSAAWCDFDEDGWPDLYVANDVSDNAFYRNLGNGTFEDISHAAWVADYRGAMGLAVGDWDGDTDMDIFITHWIAQENALYSNQKMEYSAINNNNSGSLKFMDEADRYGLGQIALDYIGWGTSFFDYDNDGKLDLFVANGSTFQEKEKPWLLIPMDFMLFWNRGPQQGFYEVSAVSGEVFRSKYGGRGAAFADYDKDGDVDIFVVNNGGAALLLRNDGGNRKNWLQVNLQGTQSNRQAIGARLRVVVGDTIQVRQVGAQSSYCSQNSLIEHFGLGNHTQADTVEIVWPSGMRQVLQNVAANQLINVDEGRNGAQKSLAEKEKIRQFWEIYRQATDHRIAGRAPEAAAAYREALALNDQHEDALYYFGNMCFELGEFAEARQAWERLAQVNPSSARAHLRLGDLRLCLERPELFNLEAAEREYRRALEINKEETGPTLRLGQAALMRGDFAQAQRYFDVVLGFNSKSAEAHYLHGYMVWTKGSTQKALDWFAKAVEYSHTIKPIKGVMAEGDTKTGRALDQRKNRTCETPFQTLLEDLSKLDNAKLAQQQMENSYRNLDAFLQRARAMIK